MKGFDVLTVSQLNFYVRSILEDDQNLKCVFLRGEISNFKNHLSSGHLYFSLKDEKSLVKCVMFSSSARYLKFVPESGMNVLLRGRISVYEGAGQYQLYVDDMYPEGIGEFHFAFELLKKKLMNEGLFDESKKKRLPNFPKRIGVITSKSGAVIQDIRNVVSRRWPLCEIILRPVNVQGKNAAPQIVDAIKLFNERSAADVLIIARGGGSIEDLWPFNDENLAREISRSHIPIVSAVGHETDFTICDFVADLRAPTPSAAAEIVVPDEYEVNEYLSKVSLMINSLITNKFSSCNIKLDNATSRLKVLSPMFKINTGTLQLRNLEARLKNAMINVVNDEKSKVATLISKLEVLSPLSVLSRGYSIAYKDEMVIKTVESVSNEDLIKICFVDGEIKCKVIEKKGGTQI